MDDNFKPPEQQQFENFLIAHPEHKETIRMLGQSIHAQITLMALPKNNTCLSIIKTAIHIFESADDDSYAYFRELTGLDKFGPQLTPAQKAEAAQKIADLRQTINSPEENNFLSKIMAKILLQHAAQESQGLGKEPQRQLKNFIATHHIEQIAEIVRDGSTYALLDENCVNIKDINDAMNEISGETITLRDRYHMMVGTISNLVAHEITDHVTSLVKQDHQQTEKSSHQMMKIFVNTLGKTDNNTL